MSVNMMAASLRCSVLSGGTTALKQIRGYLDTIILGQKPLAAALKLLPSVTLVTGPPSGYQPLEGKAVGSCNLELLNVARRTRFESRSQNFEFQFMYIGILN